MYPAFDWLHSMLTVSCYALRTYLFRECVLLAIALVSLRHNARVVSLHSIVSHLSIGFGA